MSMIRLDKFLADAGQGTRSQVKNYIKQGLVAVNDVPEKRADRKVDTERDTVSLKGKLLTHEELVYYMLHKPQGVVSATKDEREKTVLSLITEDKRRDLFPVGRLDKDTEGLLLITNDGKLANNLLTPGKHVAKKYFARIKGVVTEQEVERFARGVDIGDEELTMPAELLVQSSGEESEVIITITEGRYHQIKRMFEALGMKVIYLKRISMGELCLDETLPCGAYRRLTEEEIETIRR